VDDAAPGIEKHQATHTQPGQAQASGSHAIEEKTDEAKTDTQAKQPTGRMRSRKEFASRVLLHPELRLSIGSAGDRRKHRYLWSLLTFLKVSGCSTARSRKFMNVYIWLRAPDAVGDGVRSEAVG
jgi:hypothetical protein